MPFAKGSPTADVRRSHLGWALYARIGDTSCYLRSPKKCPPPNNLLNRPPMPAHVCWPITRDWANARAMIEGIIAGNIQKLEVMVLSYPGHHFGFEEYLAQLRDIIHASKREMLPTVANLAPKAVIINACELSSVPIPSDVPPPGILVRLELVTWDSNQTSLRMRIVHPLPPVKDTKGAAAPAEQVFSTILIDTVSGRWGLEEHHPGWYRAYGLSPNLWKRYMGKATRRTALPRPAAPGTMARPGDATWSDSPGSTSPPKPSETPSAHSSAPLS